MSSVSTLVSTGSSREQLISSITKFKNSSFLVGSDWLDKFEQDELIQSFSNGITKTYLVYEKNKTRDKFLGKVTFNRVSQNIFSVLECTFLNYKALEVTSDKIVILE